MKYIFSAFIIIVSSFLCSCTEDGKPLNQFFNTDSLPPQYYDIYIHTDTIIKTSGGASIIIDKDAISNSLGLDKIQLEIKEAYTITDIVKAGLKTRSGDQLLSSGGMIYINAKNARIDKKIGVVMPSTNYKEEMQLFQGKVNNDGIIDWVNPQPMLGNTMYDTFNSGKKIYADNCSSCHSISKDATGPSLAFVTLRRDRKWLNNFIHNSSKMIADGDPLANCIYEKWYKTAMTAFPTLTDRELESLYFYIDEESKKFNPNNYADFKQSLDSCITYTNAKHDLEFKLYQLIIDNGSEAEKKKLGTTVEQIQLPKNMITPKYEASTYYQFNITTFGWYNADAFTMNLSGFVPTELKVKINNPFENSYNIYLIIPDEKVCADGGFLKGQHTWYGFYTDDGKLSLPKYKDAYILAFCERDNKISFALHQFKTHDVTEIALDAIIITKEEMQEKLATLKFDGLDIKVDETKNVKEVKEIEIDLDILEKLKPKDCDCDCLPSSKNEKDTNTSYYP